MARRSLRHSLVVGAAVALVGAAGGVLGLGLASATTGRVGPGRVQVEARFHTSGLTRLGLPPLGSVSAGTHASPVLLEADVEQLDVDAVQKLLAQADPEAALYADARADLDHLVGRFVRRALVVAAVAGAVAGGLVPRRRRSHVLTGLVAGPLAVGGLLVWAWAGYDTEAFAEASFVGPIERAPAVIETVRRHVAGFEDLEQRIDVLSRQISDLYRLAAEPVPGPSGDETRILHVSDIHSNPLGAEVVAELAHDFGVAAVLDTGDLTSFGLPIEARIGELVSAIPVPYLFVPGNHDSPENRAALAQLPNVRVLDGTMADVGGVRILGVADPTYTATNEITSDQAAAVREAQAPLVAALVDREDPDVLAVHDVRTAVDAFGSVPLVLGGHFHERKHLERDGSTVQLVGSTGATGLGSFTVDTNLPYEAEVLHFSAGCLTAVDYVTLRGVGGDFRIDRDVRDADRCAATDQKPDQKAAQARSARDDRSLARMPASENV